MMMAATRRSFRTKKASPKSKRHSRKSHQDVEQPHRSSDHAFYKEEDRDREPERKENGKKSFPSSIPPPVFSRHGDHGDSGIDSGNGHADPESPLVRLGENGFDSASGTHREPEHSNPSSPERQKHRSREASVSSNDGSSLRKRLGEKSAPTTLDGQFEDDSPPKTRGKRPKSRHRKRRSSDSEETEQKSQLRENSPVSNHVDSNASGADSAHSALEASARTDPSHSARVSEDSDDTTSDAPNHATKQAASKEKDLAVHVPDSNGLDNSEKESEGSSSENESGSREDREDDRKPLDAISVTSNERRDRKRKLKARLEQAKHSLASPHITAAVEVFEASENVFAGPPDMSLVQEFRKLFQQELIRLRLELDTFRHFCCKQMEKEAESVFVRHRDKHREEEKDGKNKDDDQTATEAAITDKNDDSSGTQTKEAEGEKSEEKKAKSPDELDSLEDKLLARQKDLHDYEKEILEVETMLNQRQAICERRQSALLALDEELQSLREDIFSKKEVIKKDDDTSEERARKNWDLVRRHLTDKQAMLEAAVQRYRTQIAGSNAALAAKDTLIAHLQKQLKETQETLKGRDRKVSQLETKLVLATEELHVLSALHNNDPATGPASPDSGDPLATSHTSFKRASFRRGSTLAQRQRSIEGPSSSSTSSDPRTSRGSLRRPPPPPAGSGSNGDHLAAANQSPGHRSVSAPPPAHPPAFSERPRRMSSAAAHVPEPDMTRRKSVRPMSARERRMQMMQQRRKSSEASASGGGGGGGEGGATSGACAIL